MYGYHSHSQWQHGLYQAWPSHSHHSQYYPMSGPCQQPYLSSTDSARDQIEYLLHINNPWPDCHDQMTIKHLCRAKHSKEIIIAAMKAALAFGGPHASRAAYLLSSIPQDSLADLVGELKALSNPLTGLGCTDTIQFAEYYLYFAEEAKKKRDTAANDANWDVWCEFAGHSRVAWPAPPDDSVYAYPKIPDDVPTPKEPEGWKWMLVPQQPTSYLASVTRWGPFS